MKNTIIALVLILANAFYSTAMGNTREQQDPQSVKKLWKEYKSAQASDRPQKQASILEELKKASKAYDMPWDFYQASCDYVNVRSSINWKERDELLQSQQKEIEEYGEPVLTFYYRAQYGYKGLFTFTQENKAELLEGKHSEFYDNDYIIHGAKFSPVLVTTLENDYEYVLWSIYLRNILNGDNGVEMSKNALLEYYAGSYPKTAFIEYRDCPEKDLSIFAERYKDKAAGLMAKEDLLYNEFRKMNEKKATSDEFIAFRQKCGDFEKERKAFKDSEKSIADCCTRVLSLIAQLDERSVFAEVENGILSVRLQNLKDIDVSIDDEKKNVWKKTLDNPAKSYYVYDTVVFKLPDINDGTYTLTCSNGKTRTELDYYKYSLSLAHKVDSKGPAIFVANAVTGEPVKVYDIESKTTVKGFKQNDGFTYLPKELVEAMSGGMFNIVCSYTDAGGILRKTQPNSVSNRFYPPVQRVESLYGTVIKDRSAFNPGEKVQFKVILYRGNMQTTIKAAGEGVQAIAELVNPKGSVVETRKLTTNDFGSAAGEFDLPREERNGRFTIRIRVDGNVICSTDLRVDDFVLPTFELTWDSNDVLYFNGDEVTIKGKVKSYSGHSLGAAQARWEVVRFGDVYDNGELEFEPDGSFTIKFKSEPQWNSSSYVLTARVIDATGETLEWTKVISVYDRIPLTVSILDKAIASCDDGYPVLSSDIVRFNIDVRQGGMTLKRSSLELFYTITNQGRTVSSGKAEAGKVIEVNTSKFPSGTYTLKASATAVDAQGQLLDEEWEETFIQLKDGDSVLMSDVENVFKVIDGEDIIVQFGAGRGPVWACVELFGPGNVPLHSELVHLKGQHGKDGSLTTLKYEFPELDPEVVTMQVIYFRNLRRYSWMHTFDRTAGKLSIPLSFTRFEDKTLPGTAYKFLISTAPFAEGAVSIFDKSTETIASNFWANVSLQGVNPPYVSYSAFTGDNSSRMKLLFSNGSPRALGGALRSKSTAAPAPMPGAAVLANDAMEMVVMEESMAMDNAEYGMAIEEEALEAVTVRANFANTIAFEPFLKSDADGRMALDFTTADKLSTYYVSVFVHNKEMSNATLRKEMVVSIPVKVSIVEPQFLYIGDEYVVKTTLSNNTDKPVSGTLVYDLYDSKDYRNRKPFKEERKRIAAAASGATASEHIIKVPDIEELGIKVTFVSDDPSNGNDAVFTSVPVLKPVQTITEAHSAVLLYGKDKDHLIDSLKKEFKNFSGDEATISEVTILDMVKDALPKKFTPASKNVLDLSESLYSQILSASLSGKEPAKDSLDSILSKILKCQNTDGGFAWFEGMTSSGIITVTVLERFALLAAKQVEGAENYIPSDKLAKAVRFLDGFYFEKSDFPFWFGGISLSQYLYVRAMYPAVDFTHKDVDKKVFSRFRKETREYLVPSKDRGLNGLILNKAKRLRTLQMLQDNESGIELTKAWGIKFCTARRLQNSLKKDYESLIEYAVTHKSGGTYYPNAVMPFRGLLESELYAHSLMCNLMQANASDSRCKDIAEGIRIWLMVQKETQQWDSDPAFIDAINCVLDGSDETLQTKVVILKASKDFKLDEIKEAKNGMSVARTFYVEKIDGEEKVKMPLKDGDVLSVGDKVIAQYSLWNEENRSFVRLTAARPANLRPVDQLSGRYGWWLSPLRVQNYYSLAPQGYRNVLADKTEYWFDSYPEEKTSISEEFFVTQAGEFQTPVMEFECLYAPHYRANSASQFTLQSK